MFRRGTNVDINQCVGIGCASWAPEQVDQHVRGSGRVESNQRFYFRRAAEERLAAQRAITNAAREWHAKLAQQFAAKAAECEQAASAA